ncbi:hypothetical protein ACQKWADRAFT_307772 [Trichoderma austrokoningii]
MAYYTLGSVMATVGLFYYFVFTLLSYHHKLLQSLKFFPIFGAIRTVNSITQIAITSTSSNTIKNTLLITAFFSLPLLLLAALDIISHQRFFYIVRIAQLAIAIALILCIIGVASANTVADIAHQAVIKIAVIIFLSIFLLLISGVIYISIHHQCETKDFLLLGMLLALFHSTTSNLLFVLFLSADNIKKEYCN